MPAFRGAGTEQVNAFEIRGTYLFKYYFEGDAVFQRLKQYYNNSQYRFEVPPEEFQTIRDFLADHGYALALVEVPEEFMVVVRKYTAHPTNIFRESVAHRGVTDYNCFLLRDREAVDRAVEEGAVRLTDTNVENPF